MAWMYRTLLILWLVTACTGHKASERNAMMQNSSLVKLSSHLMDGYNKAVRPVLNWRNLTTVAVDVTLYAILGVDEKNQLLSTYIWLNQSWVDQFLIWDPVEFDNVSQISLPVNLLWAPDISIVESVNEEKPREIGYAYITKGGRVFYSRPMHVMSTCNLNIYYFPFDRQNCSLTLASWTHKIDDIDLTVWRNTLEHYKLVYKEMGEWDLKGVYSQHREWKDHDISFGEVVYNIILKRRPDFYIVNLIFPSMLLVIVDIVGFYLPPEGGERISFKITLLLGYSVFLIIVSEKLPATGMPLIGVYFMLCMIMLVVSLMESIIIVRIIHKENLHPDVPKWLKTFILEIVAPWVCHKKWAQFAATEEDNSTSTEQTGQITEKSTSFDNEYLLVDTRQMAAGQDSQLLLNILKEVGSIREHLKKSDQEYIIQEWLRVGYLIDKLLFRAYLVFLLVSAVTLVGVWLYGNLMYN